MNRKTIPIYHGDDEEQLYELRTAVEVAERRAEQPKAARRFGDDEDDQSDVAAAKDAYNAFVEFAAERAEKWVIESIGHEAWRNLLADHPPREIEVPATAEAPASTAVHPDDREWGFNVTTFPAALLQWVDPDDAEHRTLAAAGTTDVTDVDALRRRIGRLSEGQFETIWGTAWALNTRGISDPKAARF